LPMLALLPHALGVCPPGCVATTVDLKSAGRTMQLFMPAKDVAAENEAIAAILGVDLETVTGQRAELDPFDDAIGQKLWPASVALSRMLQTGGLGGVEAQVKDRDVVEVGCGLGGVGIAAALAGARSVVLTDFQEKSLELAAAAAEANGVGDRVSTRLLDWTDPGGLEEWDPPDLVLGSDVLYSKQLAGNLLDVISALLLSRPRDRGRPEAKAMLIDPPRRPARPLLPELCNARGLFWGGELPVPEADESGTVLINILRG